MSLIFAEAQALVGAAHERAAELDIKISAAVVALDGHLIALGRMDGGAWLTVRVAETKARTAAMFGRAGADLGRMPSDLVAAVASANGVGLMAAPGVAAIVDATGPVGYIGCSGGSGAQDQDCADVAGAHHTGSRPS